MCGLFGVMSRPIDINDRARFHALALLSQLRGEDGCGFMQVNKTTGIPRGKDIHIHRSLNPSGVVVNSQRFMELLKMDSMILAGHCRAATKGELTTDNLHPHMHKHIVLFHNGTMFDVMDKKIPDKASDSKMIAQALAENDVQDFVDNSWGAFALVWADLKEHTLNFLRNDERPLWFGKTGYGESVVSQYWASEARFLDCLIPRWGTNQASKFSLMSLPSYEQWVFPLSVEHTIKVANKIERKKKTKVYQPSGRWNTSGAYYNMFEDADQTPTRSTTNITTTGGITKNGLIYHPPHTRTPSTATVPTVPIGKRISGMLSDMRNRALGQGTGNDNATFCQQQGAAPLALPRPSCSTEVWEKNSNSNKEQDFLVTDNDVVKSAVIRCGCSWCSDTPVWDQSRPPKIYSLKRMTGLSDYFCEGCVKDVQEVRDYMGLGAKS